MLAQRGPELRIGTVRHKGRGGGYLLDGCPHPEVDLRGGRRLAQLDNDTLVV